MFLLFLERGILGPLQPPLGVVLCIFSWKGRADLRGHSNRILVLLCVCVCVYVCVCVCGCVVLGTLRQALKSVGFSGNLRLTNPDHFRLDPKENIRCLQLAGSCRC